MLRFILGEIIPSQKNRAMEPMLMDFICDFQPRQIVCLEHESTRLYAEVIQVGESRPICWVRPLLLAPGNYLSGEPLIYDLRPTADLVWPLIFFRPALDTEVIPLLVELLASEAQLDSNPVAVKQLNQFIHKVWQAHQENSFEL